MANPHPFATVNHIPLALGILYVSLVQGDLVLVPYWAKDIKIGFSTINAMAETVDTKPVFREAFKRRRCLVPIEAFYEWKKIGPKEKQPYAIALADRSIMALAGLWETWRSSAQETIRSFTIITTTPNEMCAEVHNRMPVILPPETWAPFQRCTSTGSSAYSVRLFE